MGTIVQFPGARKGANTPDAQGVLWLDAEALANLERLAAECEMTPSEWIEDAIDEAARYDEIDKRSDREWRALAETGLEEKLRSGAKLTEEEVARFRAAVRAGD